VKGDADNVDKTVDGTDGGQFTVTANGKVTFDANADFEPLNDGDTEQTSVAVTVADEAGNENTSTVTATVEGVNDDPTNLSVDNATVRQSAGVNATVGTLSAEDVDNDVANLTYTLVAGTGDANNSAFRIDGDDLQARNASTMADGEYDVRVEVDDPDGGTTAEPFTVTVVDDVAPIVGPVTLTDATDGNGILAAGDDLTITATVTDVTAVDTVRADAAAFDNATVTLEETATDTYETTVTVGNDPAEFDQSVTVNATDTLDNGGDQATVSESIVVDTTPPTTRDDTGRASEDTTGTRLIADVRASNTDAVSAATDLVVTAVDGNESVVDAPVTGTNGGRFTVSADGRVLFDADGRFESLGVGDTASTRVEATVADEAGNEATQTITAVVRGVNDAPTGLALDHAPIVQSAGANATVGTLSAGDVDGDALSYSLVSGSGDTDNAAFAIDGATLLARDASTMPAGRYEVRVRAADGNGGTDEESFAITVEDDLPPRVTSVVITDRTDANGIVTAGDTIGVKALVTDVTDVQTVTATLGAFDADGITLDRRGAGAYRGTAVVGATPTEGDHSATVNATDPAGNGGTQAATSGTLVVDTTPPTTRDDTGRASEDATGAVVIADLRANDTDGVSASSDLAVTAVGGDPTGVATPVPGTNGGRFTITADGRVLFDGNADFEPLDTGETNRTSVSVTVADEAGNEATQTVTAVVDGVTDETGGGGGSSASIGRATPPSSPTQATPSSSPAQTSTVSLQDVYGGQRIVVDFARQQVTTSVVPPADASAASGRAQASVPADDVRNVQSDGLVLTVADRGDYDLTVTARDVDVFARNARSAATDAPTTADDAASDDSAGDVASSDADLSTDALGEASRQFVEATARRPVGFITVDHSFEPDDLETATHRFRVRKSYLAATGATAEGVTLYRDGPDGYRDLPTREVDADETFHYFEAETPGFSTFVIGTDAPVFDLGDPALVTADETSGRVEATVPVENVGSHAGTYTARLRGDGTVLATTTVSVPPGETVTARVQTTLPDADGVTLSLAGRSLGTVSSGGQETVAEADEEPSDSSSPLVAVGVALLVFVVLAGVILGAWRRTEPTDESTDDADDESTDDVTVDPATETPPAAADEPAPDGPERAASEAVSDTPGGRSGRPDTERATDDQYSGEPDAGASDTTAPPGTTDATRSTAANDPSAESADTASEERPPSETDESSEER